MGSAVIPCRDVLFHQEVGERREGGDDHVRLVRRFAIRPAAAVNEGRSHTVGLGADTIEGVIGHMHDTGSVLADDLRGLLIRRIMGLEGAGFLHGNRQVEIESNVWFGTFEHIPIAIRQDDQAISGTKPVQSLDDI